VARFAAHYGLARAYAKPFFFGCEPDDRMNAVAFSKLNPFGARINAIFSSDVGQFDIPDMRMVLPEAWELSRTS
jgi:hypothetical protein